MWIFGIIYGISVALLVIIVLCHRFANSKYSTSKFKAHWNKHWVRTIDPDVNID